MSMRRECLISRGTNADEKHLASGVSFRTLHKSSVLVSWKYYIFVTERGRLICVFSFHTITRRKQMSIFRDFSCDARREWAFLYKFQALTFPIFQLSNFQIFQFSSFQTSDFSNFQAFKLSIFSRNWKSCNIYAKLRTDLCIPPKYTFIDSNEAYIKNWYLLSVSARHS